jgi:hypothetical protein
MSVCECANFVHLEHTVRKVWLWGFCFLVLFAHTGTLPHEGFSIVWSVQVLSANALYTVSALGIVDQKKMNEKYKPEVW